MKKLCLAMCLIVVGCCLGCESDGLKCAYLTECTQSLSTDYAIKMILDKDKRVEDKYVELQIKSSTEGQKVTFGAENENKYVLNIEEKNNWYNLTTLISDANGLSNTEQYEKYVDKNNMLYTFYCSNDTTLTFRVVVGNVVENSDATGQILTSTEAISKELKVDVKKKTA